MVKRRTPANDNARRQLMRHSLVCRTALMISFFVAVIAVYYNVDAVHNITRLRGDTKLNKDTDAKAFEVRRLHGRGMGLVALRDIQQGELILREEPLFVVPPQIIGSPTALIAELLAKITPQERAVFFNLSYAHFPSHLEPEKHPNEVALAIFQTNAVAAGDSVGIFPGMARLNHGCSSAFNVVYSWRDVEGSLVVQAIRNISKGQELLTTYTDTKKPRDQRREYLSQAYGFHCTCSVCSLPDEQSRLSDKRLTEMSTKYQQLATWDQDAIKGSEAISLVMAIWSLGQEEGYWSERGQLAADAAWVAAAHSDATATQAWSQLALKWYTYELGVDSQQAQEMRMIVARPQAHRAWGTRDILDVGGPQMK